MSNLYFPLAVLLAAGIHSVFVQLFIILYILFCQYTKDPPYLYSNKCCFFLCISHIIGCVFNQEILHKKRLICHLASAVYNTLTP